MGRKITFALDEFYHVYNRGTEKRNIFSSQRDYGRFVSLLYFCNSTEATHLKVQGRTLYELEKSREGKTIVDIAAYCLMPNHFHLLVREKQDRGISHFMQKLTTGYTMYFNKHHERVGALFQGTYKASHVANDNYLKYLISYIHLNPVKLVEPKWKETGIRNRKHAEAYLGNYRYSSYLDYLGKNRLEKMIVHMNALPRYFESPKDFKTSVTEWLNYNTK